MDTLERLAWWSLKQQWLRQSSSKVTAYVLKMYYQKSAAILQKNQEQTEEVCEAMADENEDKAPQPRNRK